MADVRPRATRKAAVMLALQALAAQEIAACPAFLLPPTTAAWYDRVAGVTVDIRFERTATGVRVCYGDATPPAADGGMAADDA